MKSTVNALFALCQRVTGEINFSSEDLVHGDHPLLHIAGVDGAGHPFSFYAEYDALAEVIGRLSMAFMRMRVEVEADLLEHQQAEEAAGGTLAPDDLPY